MSEDNRSAWQILASKFEPYHLLAFLVVITLCAGFLIEVLK